MESRLKELESENSYLRHIIGEFDKEGLQLNNCLHQIMLNNLPFTAWMKDTSGKFIAVNKHFEELNGKTSAEIIGKTDFELFDSESATEFISEDEYVKSNKTTLTKIHSIERNGQKEFLEKYKSPIINIDGKVIAIFGISVNVTSQFISDRKNFQQELTESAEKFRLIAENLPGVLYLCKNDEKFTTIYANANILGLFGKSSEEFVNQKVFFTDFYHPDDKNYIFEEVDKALEEQRSFRLIYRIKSENDTYKWVEERGGGIFIDGKLLYIEGIIYDINDRINLEEELKQLNSELEDRVFQRTAQLDDALDELRSEVQMRRRVSEELLEAKEELAYLLAKEKELSRLKTRFISMVSHEYRTPLTVILTSTYLLERYFFNNEEKNFRDNLSRIQESVQSIIRLLEDVITIGKDDEASQILKIEKFNIVSLINELVQETRIICKPYQVIEFKTEKNRIEVESDPLLVRRIFSNLLNNACKYSDEGTKIELMLVDFELNFHIYVTDQGIGIPEEELCYLYEPFHRFSNALDQQGTGIGLTIVKRSVELLKGEISMTSKLGNGTEFCVKLPKYVLSSQ
ncbi:MAG: ATP-binding protein [Candidatus Kapaibacterium sp.]